MKDTYEIRETSGGGYYYIYYIDSTHERPEFEGSIEAVHAWLSLKEDGYKIKDYYQQT